MRRLALLILLTVALTPARAQVAHCDCEPALVHLCRCGVLVDQRVADIQLAYLSRLLVSEFRPYLEESPVAGVRIARSSEM